MGKLKVESGMIETVGAAAATVALIALGAAVYKNRGRIGGWVNRLVLRG